MRVRFGEFILDTSARELLWAGAPVCLTGKAYRLLEVLIENRPAALSKDRLQELVWPGVFVSEANLTGLMSDLRRALGDVAHGSTFIRTVYGFGYAFCGEVQDLAPTLPEAGNARPARHRLLWGRREIALVEGENILGRGPTSNESIERDTVSRRHARIVITGDEAILEDLASKNGTFLQGKRLTAPVALGDGAEIKLGSVRMTFRVIPEARSTAAVSRKRR